MLRDADVYSQITAPLIQLEEGLIHVLSSADYPMKDINNHLMKSAGKRIRPALFFLALGFWGEEPEAHLPVALAIELIHTATLVHDDVVDSASRRRGNPTLNETWGNHTAVLTGDYLFAEAFALLANYGNVDIIREMAALVKDMSAGEIQQQLECYQPGLQYEQYFTRIAKKTARFFSVCARSAGLVSKANGSCLSGLEEYGYHIGMAFQVIDDLLDFLGDEETTGKPVAGDLRQGILTLPVLRLLEVSPHSKELAAKIASRNIDEQLVFDINREMINCGCTDYVRNVAAEFVQKAACGLDKLPPHPNRETLQRVAAFVLNRGF